MATSEIGHFQTILLDPSFPISTGSDMNDKHGVPKRAYGRRVFTICSTSDEDSSPRAPNPKLADLEASMGLVTLSSESSSAYGTPRNQDQSQFSNSNCVSRSRMRTSDGGSLTAGHRSRPLRPGSRCVPSDPCHQDGVANRNYPSSKIPCKSEAHNVSSSVTVCHTGVQTDDSFANEDMFFCESPELILSERTEQSDDQPVLVYDDTESTPRRTDTNLSAVGKDLDSLKSKFQENKRLTQNATSSVGPSPCPADRDDDQDIRSRSTTVDSARSSTVINEHEEVCESQAPTLKVEYVGKVWDAYINDFLLGSDDINEAAIYDKATKSLIACSSEFSMRDLEFAQLLESLNCLRTANRVGVTVNGKHYKTFLADGRRGLMAKGEGATGCSACQTRTLVILALHDHTGKGRRCNEELMRLGDFFWAKGL